MKTSTYGLLGMVFIGMVANSFNADARERQEVRPISGYECMSLTLSQTELMDPNINVPIRNEPSDDAVVGSTAVPTVFVAQPVDLSNGYLRVLQMTGRTGWIKADVVKPWTPLNGTHGHCIPMLMSDGRPGIAIH